VRARQMDRRAAGGRSSRRRDEHDNRHVAVVVQEESFWKMFARLREFEGWRCWWRLPAAALLYAAVPLFFIGATVLAASIAGNTFDLETAIIAAVVGFGATSTLGPHLSRRRFHRRLVADHQWSYESVNPVTEVPVLLRGDDVDAARFALRRAKLNPRIHVVRHGIAPADAPDLQHELKVYEPDAWRLSTSDAERRDRVVAVLEAAGIRARAGGIDTQPALPVVNGRRRTAGGRRTVEVGDASPETRKPRN
jgi:hypothetical protein